MYTKDKDHRITLRLNDTQFAFVKTDADLLGVSPSEYLRMIINATMNVTKQSQEKMREKFEGSNGRENDKAIIDN